VNVAAKTTVSVRRGENMWRVPASLPSPFLLFWKNNIAMTLTIISARNRFFGRLSMVSYKLGKVSNTYLFQIRACKIVIM
jgi:hypothetical protein